MLRAVTQRGVAQRGVFQGRGWQAGARVVRSAPWAGLLGVSLVAALLLVVATLTAGLAPVVAVLGLATCGGAAGYLLDEEASAIADATPTSRGRRVAWRLLLLALPLVVAVAGLFDLNRQDAATHWWRLLPLAIGALATGVASAAILRRRGASAPGDLAAPVTALGIVVIYAVDPLRRWVSLAPLGSTPHAGRSVALWAAITVTCTAITVVCSRDPAHS
jgi:hypothetical protein